MSSATVVRLANGGTVAVRTGVLRGAGPQGPMGPAGLKGDKGDTGPQGPQPTVTQQRSHLITNSAVAVGGDGLWYDAAMPLDTSAGEPNDLLQSAGFNPYGFKFAQTGTFFGYVRARFEPEAGSEPTGTSSNSRRIRIVDASSLAVVAESSVAAAPTEPTIFAFPVTFANVDTSRAYKLQAYSDDVGGVNLTQRSIRLFRINAGPAGVQGPQGPVGVTGPQGPTGPAGSAGSGYATYDAVIGSGDSTADPGGTTRATADQGLVTPGAAQKPSTPYFLARLASQIETFLVARYASVADRSTKRGSRTPGEVTYLADHGNLQHRESSGVDLDIARVIYSSTAPPTGAGQAAPGVLWIQY